MELRYAPQFFCAHSLKDCDTACHKPCVEWRCGKYFKKGVEGYTHMQRTHQSIIAILKMCIRDSNHEVFVHLNWLNGDILLSHILPIHNNANVRTAAKIP